MCGERQRRCVAPFLLVLSSRLLRMWPDGAFRAPCYRRLCKERRLLHRSVNHSKGEFSRIHRVGSSRVDIHTGGIDAIWKECKRAIPGNLAGGSPYIPLYVKAFQWRFCHKLSRDLLQHTGFALSSATAKTCPKRAFQTRHPSEKSIRNIRPVPINRHAAEAAAEAK